MRFSTIKTIVTAAFFLLLMSSFTHSFSQDKSLNGAWQLNGSANEEVIVFTDGYFTHTSYDLEGKKFIQTRGGHYQVKNGKLSVEYEFDTQKTDAIGQTSAYTFTIANDELTADITGNKASWKRLDNGTAPLAGVWHITERMQDEKLVPIHRTGTRKTLKILTGTRFQWAAIDPGKKEFSGTGGGTYTFENGTYTEHIEFFSRDNNRVGASLKFEGKLEGGKWHHSGLSSRGDKIYEVWSRVNTPAR
jgi:hypothetical protein